MIVAMNSKAQFAKVSTSSTHTGTKQTLHWVDDVNKADLFQDKFHSRDFDDKVFNELSQGIYVKATENRTVTLLK